MDLLLRLNCTCLHLDFILENQTSSFIRLVVVVVNKIHIEKE